MIVLKIAKNLWSKYNSYISLAISFVVVTLIMLIIVIVLDKNYAFLDSHLHLGDKKTFIDDLSALHAACIIILTFFLVFATGLLACIAWKQMIALNKTSNGEFLLQLDNRWGSREILRAREIIHFLHCKTKSHAIPEKIDYKQHIKRISNKIMQIKDDKKQHEDAIHLLNFLEFLETIGYLSNRRYITNLEVDDLMGSSICYYYQIFEDWIIERRENYDIHFFDELITLIKEIEKRENKIFSKIQRPNERH